MANQKEYKIIINGIKESIEGIGTLQDSLDRLGKKVEESGGHFKTASQGMDELAKTEQKIKEYNEEYQTALAANKAVLADNAKEIKNKLDLEKAEITVSENLRDTYAQKQQLLSAMGKVIKNTAGDTSELQAQYAELNQELKDFDASLGNHQRNVGDYGQATKNLKQELRGMQEELANMIASGIDKADPKFVALAEKAGELKDAMGDARQEVDRFASDTKKLDDVINVAQSATAAFTLWQGAMSAFGIETEGAVEAIQKLQGAMAVLQSLQQLQDSLKQNSATAKIFTKTMSIMTLGIQGTTTATKALRIALMSIGWGLIIGLIATLVTHWDDLKKTLKENIPFLSKISEKFNGLTGILRGVGQAILHFVTNPIITLAKVFKRVFAGDFTGAIAEAKNGVIKQFSGLKTAFFKGVEDSRKKVETEAGKTSKTVISKAKETASKVKDIREKMLSDLANAERKSLEELKKIKDDEVKAEEQKQKKLKSLRDKNVDAEYKYQKTRLENEKSYAKTEEERIKIENKLLDLEKEHNLEVAKREGADALGMTVEELQSRIDNVDGRWVGLNEEQKQVLQTLLTQLQTIGLAADTAKQKLNGSTSTSANTSTSTSSDDNKKKEEQLKAYSQMAVDLVNVTTDTISEMLSFAVEEAEEELDRATEAVDAASEKVEESQDRIADLQEQMKESSGAQLEQYKQQMADEVLLLQGREAEEKRLEKEKEKREKELEKKKKQQRKAELLAQLTQAYASAALTVINAAATPPFIPTGLAMSIVAGAMTAAQTAIIAKQLSKLEDGGLLKGRSHAQGGIPVGNTGIEVEGGEFVVSKKATKKYLPLLDAINAEGNGGKHVINSPKTLFADGGQLNYQRIDSNFNQLDTIRAITSAIGEIDMHPVVAITDINRGQKNLVEVRELAGARN